MKWRKARKKPIIVQFREVRPKELIRVKYPEKIEVRGEVIETPEGDLEAHVGEDYIIKGVNGELYPIKIDIFNKTYELVCAGKCVHCKICGTPIVWDELCKDPLKSLRPGIEAKQICHKCLGDLARYWLACHGI